MLRPNRRRVPNTRSWAGRSQSSVRLRFLRLEDRLAPAAFTVNSLLDDGSGSGNSGTLRYCIAQANSNTGDDTIGFAVTGTIMLASGQLTLDDTTGQTTINGPGASLLSIDAQMASRVFQVNQNVSATISGVTITHGRAANFDNGGGIFNLGMLTVANCAIRENSAIQFARGAGIANDGTGTLTLSGSTVSGNTGSERGGAGIYSFGMLTLTGCSVSGNLTSGRGGGIRSGGPLTLTDCSITGNTAFTAGGIYNFSTAQIMNCTISGNSANGSGGGIQNTGLLVLSSCTVRNNTAQVGGGISNSEGAGSNPPGTLTVTNSTINNNSGGGIENWGPATVTNCTISGNTGANGAGIANYKGTLTLTDCTISSNSANNRGGGVYTQVIAIVNATNTIIAGNQAPTNPDLDGALTTNDHNLINMSAVAAGLGPLGYYGAATQTIPLLPGSPAINAGTSNGAPTTDQRGLPRFGAVDIGAYERQAAPIVLSTMVNDGSVQRSRVTSLTMTFDAVVAFENSAAEAFRLTRNADSEPVGFTATANVIGGVTVATLNNFSGVATQFGSLADGRYTLTALTSQISANGQQLDGNYDGVGGDNYVFGDAQGLYRFFGDINGDHRVDIADYGVFSLSYLNTANYVAAFDFNGDGRIDIADYGQFSLRYLATLP